MKAVRIRSHFMTANYLIYQEMESSADQIGFTLEESSQLYKVFKAIDANNSGSIGYACISTFT